MKHLFTIIRHDLIQHLRTPLIWVVIVLSSCVFLVTGYFPVAKTRSAMSPQSTSSIGSPRYIIVNDSLGIGVSNIVRNLYTKRLRETFRTYYIVSEDGRADYTDNSDNSMIFVKLSLEQDSLLLTADVVPSEQSTIEPLLILIAQSACQLADFSYYRVRFTEPQLEKFGARKSSKLWLLVGILSLSITLSGVYGQLILRSFSEERANRLLDVLLTTVQPKTLVLARFISCSLLAILHISLWIIIIKATLFALGDTTPNHDLYLICLFAFYFVLVSTSLYQCIGIVIRKENSAVVAGYFVSLLTTLPILYFSELLFNNQGLGISILSHIPFYAPIIDGCKAILTPSYHLDSLSLVLSLVWIISLLSISVSRFRLLVERG